MKILKDESSLMFASRPAGFLKIPKIKNTHSGNKFGYIDEMMMGAGGFTATPITLPVTKPPVVAPKPITIPAPKPPPCQPRPYCIDANPPCKIAVPKGGWCEEKPKDNSAMKEESSQHIFAYVIGGVLGATAGYLIADKYKKNIYGGIFLGGGIICGGVWLYFNKSEQIKSIFAKENKIKQQ